MGLGGAGLLSALGSQTQGGVSASTDKGTIRPYEFSTAMRTPQAGQSQYFQPIQYDIAGRPSQPIDTSERNYFTQGYKALPTYEAADGGQVPQLDNMPNGGLAAIQGMREGYAPMTTVGGDIPQFAQGGETKGMARNMLEGLSGAPAPKPSQAGDPITQGLPFRMGAVMRSRFSPEMLEQIDGMMAAPTASKYVFDPASQQYSQVSVPVMQNNNDNAGMGMIQRLVSQGAANAQNSPKYAYDPGLQAYTALANGGSVPTNKMLEQMQQMKFERDMPDNLRDFVRAKRMGLMEGTMFGDEQARMMGQKPQEFMFAPGISQDGRNINALATMNKDLTDDTELKLMAMGYKTPEKSGISRYGAGINRKLGKDSDLSAFFEQSPGGRDKSFGAKYSKRFNMGGMAEGDLGGYSDGGRMLKGPGDGVSDSIPATINDKQPARLADGEFVIPARIVSELGNGSTDAGAKRLYAMMDRIQADRKKTVGKGKVAVDSKAKKHLPA
jgi:hypothetical protein